MGAFKILNIERHPSDQVIELLEENEVGTPGESMVYKHRDVRSKVHNTPNPYFANLSIRNSLYGTVCLSKRELITFGTTHEAFYLRYFTFRESFRTRNPKSNKGKSPSQVRDDVANLMRGDGLDYYGNLVLYAYVDTNNIRSRRIIEEFGFKKKGNFNVIPFSRFYPKKNHDVEIINSADDTELKALLKEYYKKEQLVSLNDIGNNGNYFVIRKNGEIVCGAQAIPDGWEIKELPGISGKIMMKIVPKLPVIGRLFNPIYNFVFLESIYCKDGFHIDLEILLESILAHYQLSSGTICLDPKSKAYANIKKLNLGIIHKLMGEKNIELVIKSPENNMFKSNSPFFVLGHDVL